jgi:hypothetical protein
VRRPDEFPLQAAHLRLVSGLFKYMLLPGVFPAHSAHVGLVFADFFATWPLFLAFKAACYSSFPKGSERMF